MKIDDVTKAFSAWQAADHEWKKLSELIQAFDKGADAAQRKALTHKLSDLRADRERTYRAALAAMHAYHDRMVD